MRAPRPCGVCGAAGAARYRCPRCAAAYCSVPCCRTHKERCAPEPGPEPERWATGQSLPGGARGAGQAAGGPWSVEDILKEDEEQDRVPLQKLQLLGESEELRGLLLNPHLRQLLLTIDQAEDKSSLMRKFMQEPLFVEFADCCLSIVEPPEKENILPEHQHENQADEVILRQQEASTRAGSAPGSGRRGCRGPGRGHSPRAAGGQRGPRAARCGRRRSRGGGYRRPVANRRQRKSRAGSRRESAGGERGRRLLQAGPGTAATSGAGFLRSSAGGRTAALKCGGGRMSHKHLKEAFISNLNGTSLLEISLGLSLAPLCLLCRGLLLILYYLHYGKPLSSRKHSLLLDFLVLVSPLVLSCTVLSPIIFFVPILIAAFCAGIFSKIYSQRKQESRVPFRQIVQEFQKTYLDPEYVPAITVFRVYVNLLTSISILAVDFPQYPRRYAKTETYGTGVMDLGVGAFVFGNALVCPEVRQKSYTTQPKFSNLSKQFFSVWPLIILGVGRLLSVKSIEYHEHTSEYGVHWNFFFTLAFVRLAASLLLAVFPKNKSWIIAINLAVFYQLVLNTTSLKRFILHGSDGGDTRVGFLNANREGLLSLLGYLAIYLASVQVGLYLLKHRSSVRAWVDTVWFLLLGALLLFLLLPVSQAHADAVSRRMANLSYCLWVLAHSLAFFTCFVVTDLTLVFTKLLVKGSSVPSCWNVVKPPDTGTRHEGEAVPTGRDGKQAHLCLIGAVNKNQLLFFLLANVMTGTVNILIDTIHSGTAFTLCILHLYMFVNCLIMYILHAKNIVLKFW